MANARALVTGDVAFKFFLPCLIFKHTLLKTCLIFEQKGNNHLKLAKLPITIYNK